MVTQKGQLKKDISASYNQFKEFEEKQESSSPKLSATSLQLTALTDTEYKPAAELISKHQQVAFL